MQWNVYKKNEYCIRCADVSLQSPIYAIVWTTTPWTLVTNAAVAFSSTLSYSLVECAGDPCVYLVSSAFAASPQLAHLHSPSSASRASTASISGSTSRGAEWRVQVTDVPGDALAECTYEALELARHSHSGGGLMKPLLAAPYVMADKGSGLVHTSPAHGFDDFSLERPNSLSLEYICIV